MITIYHNPRCRKSREALKLLEESGRSFEVIEYLKDPLSSDELRSLVEKLNIEPLELIRRGEEEFKSNYKGKDLSPDEWIGAMADHPKLMERPIVVNGNKAAIGRPPEAILGVI